MHMLRKPFNLALVLCLGLSATVLIALGFEHIGGFIPCKLCLGQRLPYYIGAPLMAFVALGCWAQFPKMMISLGFAICAGLMVWSTYLGVFHAGVEWSWWQGPSDCSGVGAHVTQSVQDLFADLSKTPPSCDKAAARLWGLSFAGWNVLASLFWLAIATIGLKRAASI